MTIDEIRAWAASSGFSPDGDGRSLSADLGPFRVLIELRARTVVVSVTDGARTEVLVRAHARHAFVNEHGVLEGLGLSASWLARFPRGQGMAPPPWMTQPYLDAVGWTGSPAPAR